MKTPSGERNPKAHLGVGWSFPVKPVGGSLRYARYEEDIEQAIQIVLLTAQSERVMLPEFGAGVRDLVFEPNGPATRSRIAELVRRALSDWEPRIRLERVDAVASDETPELILVHVDYVVEVTNEAYNRVFPFYLLEGRG
ncbi:MAG: GPW/gp25 family protein [Gemmatimonadaceae bacterium]|nr:GPW/gp25 family protein [Gemmatimonadaceae bacterium]NUQ92458.1 GPW/gp25 family protein [Gemmatimonadaceae bacterium]NUR20748.1 GPW/gp25 family protein [Gemmatimonadaceae bacterium]NUS98592.1 GPW/gp25 family protein [Gemmatimonadaceae bacterium]